MMLFSWKQYLPSSYRGLHCITFKTKISLSLGLKCNAFFFFFFYLSAQELASQDEKLLLMESSLKATQEQLSEQIAETVRQEQNSRKSQTELKTLRERIITSEEEISAYKWVTAFSVFKKQKTLNSTVNPFNMYCINNLSQVRCNVNVCVL